MSDVAECNRSRLPFKCMFLSRLLKTSAHGACAVSEKLRYSKAIDMHQEADGTLL